MCRREGRNGERAWRDGALMEALQTETEDKVLRQFVMLLTRASFHLVHSTIDSR